MFIITTDGENRYAVEPVLFYIFLFHFCFYHVLPLPIWLKFLTFIFFPSSFSYSLSHPCMQSTFLGLVSQSPSQGGTL